MDFEPQLVFLRNWKGKKGDITWSKSQMIDEGGVNEGRQSMNVATVLYDKGHTFQQRSFHRNRSSRCDCFVFLVTVV